MKGQPPSLDGFDIKVRRAQVHLDLLEEQIGLLAMAQRHTFRVEVRDSGRRHIYFPVKPPPPDPMWSAIIGDCLHNLRSALDHLANQLVKVSSNQPRRFTQFPILNKRPTNLLKVTKGMSPEVVAVIELVQPYNGRDLGKNLKILDDLAVIDKHRTLIVTTQVAHAGAMRYSLSKPVQSPIRERFSERPLVHDEPMLWLTFDPPKPDPYPELVLLPEVWFEQGSVAAGDKVLDSLGILIETVGGDVRSEFARFFT